MELVRNRRRRRARKRMRKKTRVSSQRLESSFLARSPEGLAVDLRQRTEAPECGFVKTGSLSRQSQPKNLGLGEKACK